MMRILQSFEILLETWIEHILEDFKELI